MNDKNFSKIESILEKIGASVQKEPLPSDSESHFDEAIKRAKFDNKNKFANHVRRIAAGAAAIAIIVLSIWGTLKLMNVDITPGDEEKISGNIQASLISAVTINGVIYEYDYADEISASEIIPGIVFATVEVGSEAFTDVIVDNNETYDENQRKIAEASVTSTVLKAGTQIYERQGYSPFLRLCAYDDNGTLISFTVTPRTSSLEAGSRLNNCIDFTGMIKSAVITDNNPTVIGEITDESALSKLEKLLNEAVVTGERDYSFIDGEIIRVRLTLYDHSEIELLTARGETTGALFAVLRFDSALMDIIENHITNINK